LLVAGARFDFSDTFENRLSPRAAIILRPYREGTIKLLYGEGFRNPSLFEAFVHDNYDVVQYPAPMGAFKPSADGRTVTPIPQNSVLAPEVIRTAEVLFTH